ncbi:MAG: hypothetical protein L3J47_06000 [Sulfurovum sp.]|nr:hypothetical protein [Sulfurovum sp.]
MLYYYAHTGHKIGLERARRGVTVMKKLAEKGIETQLLVNDFRAGVAMKEEQGLKEYVTIETIQDIDAIAVMGDSVIIDSNEDDHGRLVKYVADFKQVWRFAHDAEDRSVHGEILFKTGCDDETCEEAVIIDDFYFKEHAKEERTLLFLRDHDHEKVILSNPEFFNSFDMELLLGHYFFVKYEDDLAKLFSTLHEPEEYTECISSSSTVVTASSQAALEARAGGAKVVFIRLQEDPIYPEELLVQHGVEVVEGLDAGMLEKALATATAAKPEMLKPFNVDGILKKY